MSEEEILEKVQAGELTIAEAKGLLAAKAPKASLYCKVSEKGCLSVYGLQRMPVSLYVEQWERLFEFSDEIRRFALEHEGELKRKAK